MKNLKPNTQNAKYAIVLIWVMLLIEIISLISGSMQYNLLESVSNGIEITPESANANDKREQLIGFIYIIAFLISAVTFIKWFQRAYSNLHLKVDNLSSSENWPVYCWFIPILNLFRPFQIMEEMFTKTNVLLIKNNTNKNINLSKNIVKVWWGLWLLNNFIGQFFFRYSLKAETLNELTTATIIGMIANVMGIPLAIITVKMIKQYSKLEMLLPQIDNETETIEDKLLID